MTLDFVLAHPTALFVATEQDKVALLRERSISSAVWPHRSHAPRRPGGRTTTRYFVDKMPWYQEGKDDRIWIGYVDAERTLQGFETFLDQYRALLASMTSGVTYVAPTVWRGVIQNAFTKALESRHAGIMSRFHDYGQFRRSIEDARSNAPLTPYRRLEYGEQCAEFVTPTFDALHRQCIQTSSITSTAVNAAAFPPCLLCVYALCRRYDPERATETRTATKRRVT